MGDDSLVAEYSTQISQTPKVSYLTADHLGSPRIITDESGMVVSRHDYTGLGVDVAETIGNVGGRTAGQGYGTDDKLRNQYTGYQRDEESGLDYAQARNYNSSHGRFTSVDPLTASASIKNPQTFNRYSYVLNSPYKFVDPLGLIPDTTESNGSMAADTSGKVGAFDSSTSYGQDSWDVFSSYELTGILEPLRSELSHGAGPEAVSPAHLIDKTDPIKDTVIFLHSFNLTDNQNDLQSPGIQTDEDRERGDDGQGYGYYHTASFRLQYSGEYTVGITNTGFTPSGVEKGERRISGEQAGDVFLSEIEIPLIDKPLGGQSNSRSRERVDGSFPADSLVKFYNSDGKTIASYRITTTVVIKDHLWDGSVNPVKIMRLDK